MGKPSPPTSYDRKREIGVVMQNVAVFDELTVRENVDYFCGLYILIKRCARLWWKRRSNLSVYGLYQVLSQETQRRPAPPSEHRLRDCPQTQALIMDEPTVPSIRRAATAIWKGF
jgi:ABC-2 type transport system ATP-binding protein